MDKDQADVNVEHTEETSSGCAEVDGTQEEIGDDEIICEPCTQDDSDEEELIVRRVCDPVGDDEGDAEDGDAEEEGQTQRPLRDPGMPTPQEVEEHNIAHIPFRPWCLHCLRGKGKDTPSRTVKGGFAEDLVPRVRMDYTSLTESEYVDTAEQVETDKDAEHDIDADNKDTAKVDSSEDRQPMLVMQESSCESIWSYAVERKGASETWITGQL